MEGSYNFTNHMTTLHSTKSVTYSKIILIRPIPYLMPKAIHIPEVNLKQNRQKGLIHDT